MKPRTVSQTATSLLMTLACWTALAAAADFRPGEIWHDTAGQPIQAHGGGGLLHQDTYYWFGEDRSPGQRGAVACYSSTNLLDWRSEGTALSADALPVMNGRRTFVERPKVIFNPRMKQFVMWMHLEQGRYHLAHAGIATSGAPNGPFQFERALRPVANTNDFRAQDPDPNQEKIFGGTFRDMNLFVDDGRAYVFYAAEDNWTMYVARLNADFTGPELPAVEGKTWNRILVREHREAPAPFKWRGKYFLITSGCTGWKPNAADVAVANEILGPYRPLGNPCAGPDAATTFGSQSTFVLPAPGQPDRFIFMADRWNPGDLPDSRYVWLPFTMRPDGTFTLTWRDQWTLAPK